MYMHAAVHMFVAMVTEGPGHQGYFKEEDKDRDTLLEADFSKFKAKYYQEKMGFTNMNRGVLEEQAKCYVVGIQWILHYYYSGVPS